MHNISDTNIIRFVEIPKSSISKWITHSSFLTAWAFLNHIRNSNMTVSDLWVLMSLFRSVILLPLIGNRQTLKQSSTKNNIKTVKPTHNNHKNVKSLKHQVIRHSKDRRLQQEQAESLFSVNTADFVFTLHFILFYFIFYGHLLLIHSEACCFCSVCLHVLD